MALVRVSVRECIQDSQDFGSDDEHMVSRVFFDIESRGSVLSTYCEIKQTIGSDYLLSPIEVYPPANYRGPYNHEIFGAKIEKYYRSLIGTNAIGIQVGGPGLGARLRMRNNRFQIPFNFEFEAAEDPRAGW